MLRSAILLLACLIAASCAVERPGVSTGSDRPTAASEHSAEVDAEPAITRVTCGNTPGFDLAVLDQPAGAEQADDPAAAALRRHITGGAIETEWLPDEGWIEAVRTPDEVFFIARDDNDGFSTVAVELMDGQWTVGGWGGCRLEAAVAEGVGLARFRVAPEEELTPETTEVDVLVTEMACNSGQDATGRILPPVIHRDAENVTVVMTVRPRGGAQDCPSNPETPFLLELPEPLGDRALLDGSEVPARDAMECEDERCP